VRPVRGRGLHATHRNRLGRKWRVDETFLKIGGRWMYAFRAIDQDGQIVECS
jgi:transposase-like protein